MPTTVTDYTSILTNYSWAMGTNPTSQPVIVTYSFPTTPSSYLSATYSAEGVASVRAFTSAEQATARQALALWGDISGIVFLEAPAGKGDIQFSYINFDLVGESGFAGYAYYPSVYSTGQWALGGDVFVNTQLTMAGDSLLHVLVHEIGHAIGFKHPFDGDPVLPKEQDNYNYTVMSYTSGGTMGTTLGTYDVQAVQHLYGLQSADGTGIASWSWNAGTLTQGGSAAADTIRGVYGDNVISGGDGDDSIVGGYCNNVINGDAGNDKVYLSGGTGTISGGIGDDYISSNDGTYNISGDIGNDTIIGSSGTATIHGGDGADNIWLWYDGAYTAYGDAGDDVIGGSDGADQLYGGDGRDNLTGAEGNDTLNGGAGNDNLYGNAGDDVLSGGDDSDTLGGGAGANTLDGGAGTDTAYFDGSASDYFVTTTGGTTTVIGTGETDTLTNIEQVWASGSYSILSLAQFQAQAFSTLQALEYIASYKDLMGAFGDNATWGATHYFNNGKTEGRAITFNALNYICSYGDLIVAFHDDQLAATEHYLKNGSYEGRKVSFDPLAYVCSYNDLLIAFNNNQTAAAEHYIHNGYWEGRKVTFDALAYICSYSDLVVAYRDDKTAAEEHYLRNGYWEGRKVTFDALAYLCSYNDLLVAFHNDKTAAEEHYIKNGFWEGRRVTFNALAYIASYTDLIGAFGTDATAAEEHYIRNGYWEGRKVTFDPVAYLLNNTDLGTCGFTETDVTEHYLKNGYWEHRTTNGAFGSEQTVHDLIGGSVNDTIGTAGDKDWFGVLLTAGHTYTFTFSGVDGGNGTLADPFLSICDAHGVQLTYANDSTNHDATIRFTALSSGTYYLVASANGTGTGTYKLFATPGG
jgi:Ca2+-binding RTX toxin-like protein